MGGTDPEDRSLLREHARHRRARAERHVVLVGFMGSGKSSLGRALAAHLGRSFLDTDAHVEARHDRPIVDYFAAGEEPLFRQREREAVFELLAEPPAVIGLGGGTFEDPLTRATLLDTALVVYLFVPWADIRAELHELAHNRPVLAGRPEHEVLDTYLRRQRAYRSAHVRLSLPRANLARAADLLARCLTVQSAAGADDCAPAS